MSHDTIKKANWLELFFDLIFVFAISTATHLLTHVHNGHIAIEDYLTFVLVIIPILWVWTGHTLFSTRFDTGDKWQRFLTFVVMFFAVFWTAFINSDFDSYYHGYLAFYVLARTTLIIMYCNAARVNATAIPVAKNLGIGFSIGLAICISSVFFEPPYRYIVLYMGIGVEIITPLLRRSVLKAVPVASHHLPERYGIFAIVLLGESVIMLAANLGKSNWSTPVIGTVISGFVLIITLWWLYFDLVDNYAVGKNLGTGQNIVYGHLFIYSGLSSIAVFIAFSIKPELHLKDHIILGVFGFLVFIIGLLITFKWHRLAQKKYLIEYFLLTTFSAISLYLSHGFID
ncbi:low temperature requirement protein A [Vibrio breoganii]|uniref:low temperature requirement protein A n=1 Tax=Vibrio breoganii TaxID=553239 RepID=UPI000C831747|nr:low temperature requirement protein A [Vibrio breoganii]PMK26351.1 hypothetical protein BCU03_18950 [Vibrio breoganii]PML40919.1 hypothetical protein BCT78_18425 [Vibrio breoganii]